MSSRKNKKQRRQKKTSDRKRTTRANLSFDIDREFQKARQFHQSGRLEETQNIYREILEVNPHHAESLQLLGVVACQFKRYNEAIGLIKKAIHINPHKPDYYYNLGKVYDQQGKANQAIDYYEKVLEIEPDYVDAYNNLGNLLKQQGKKDEAISYYQKTLELKPDYASAYTCLADCKKFSKEDKSFAVIESLINQKQLTIVDKRALHFALGKMYDDIGDYEKAFHNYHSGNELRKNCNSRNFDIGKFENTIDRYTVIFDRDFFLSRANWGIDSDVPVFVVGMPRSGTTLIEQILSSHRQIYGAGELQNLEQLLTTCSTGKKFQEVIEQLDETASKMYAQQYLSHIRSLSKDSLRIVDKMPDNFIRLWLIKLLFPKAKIIHSIRDPRDCCLSCYFQDFKTGHYYKSDLRTLGLHYNFHLRIMEHWKKVLPLPILDVHYEELVENQERVSREIVEFCGLEWDSNCLEFHKNERFVATASDVQVRRKIYNSSIGRWKRYEKFLTPLTEALAENESGLDIDREFQKARQFHQAGRLEEAQSIYREILEVNPNHADTLHLLGVMAYQSEDYDVALAMIDKAIEIDPQQSSYYNNKGNVLNEQNNPQQALACFQKASRIDPNHPQAYNNMAATYQQQLKIDEAFAFYRKALEVSPDFIKAHNNLGEILVKVGKPQQAIECLEKALQIDPENAETYKRLSNCKKFQEGDETFAIIESLKGKKLDSVEDSMQLHFALGKMYDDVGNYEQAFHNYHSGNELRKKCRGSGFNCRDYEKQVSVCEEIFDKQFFESRSDFGLDTTIPIFIVGMPRSGTTLIEQIISSHKDVFGAGERKDIGYISVRFMNEHQAKTISDVVGLLDKDTTKRVSRQYLDSLGSLSPDAVHITDKMPQNFEKLWLIALLFPNTRVIHVQRNPIDTCLSCYFQDFTKGHPYKNDLRDLGTYYRYYQRLMDHWKNVLPIPILDVCYEELIGDQERLSRDLVEFCGLEWDNNCLEFYRNKRFVDTSSDMQVRRKIYNSSVNRWKRYEKFLTPLIEALDGNEPALDIDSEMQKGVGCLQAGQYQKAEDIFKQILKVNPDQPDALHLFGLIAYKHKKYDIGAALIKKAIRINPQQAEYYNNMGVLLNEQGKSSHAVIYFRKAVQINPQYAQAHKNMENALNFTKINAM